jgi:type II secretory pathway pseudopilin PulG
MNATQIADVRRADEGTTLVEVIVAIGLFGLLSTVLLGLALSTSRVSDDTRRMAAVSEESRLAMERMTRELRQANAILGVHLPTGATDTTAFTFWTDFNGNGAQDLTASDPEVLTYRWNPTTSRLTLTANDASGTATTRPVLAASVTDFEIELRSSLWQYDADGDGTTTWEELDASGPPLGDNDGIPDAPELEAIDLIAVSMTVLDTSHQQTYRTEIDLRNRSQS